MTTYPTIIAASAPSSFFVAGVALIAVVLLMRATRRRTVTMKSVKSVPVRQRYEELSQESAATRTLGNVMAEMDELSRQIHGRLDTKIAKLEMTIRDADERIDRLMRLKHDRGIPDTQLDVTLDSEGPAPFGGVDSDDDASAEVATEALPENAEHAHIHDLADRGMTPEQIATEIARPVGEIELILSLRRATAS